MNIHLSVPLVGYSLVFSFWPPLFGLFGASAIMNIQRHSGLASYSQVRGADVGV